MPRQLIRSFAFHLGVSAQRLTSSEVSQALDILAEGDVANYDQLWEMRSQAFIDLVNHAYHYVPYYHRIMNEYGIHPSGIHSLDDLGRFPVLTKEAIRIAGNDLRATNIPDNDCIVRRSGGTTGEPISSYVDRLARALETYSTFRGHEWMGWRKGQNIISLFGGSLGRPTQTTMRNWLKSFAMGTHFLPAFEINKENVKEYLSVISKAGPCIINGYASALLNLAILAERTHLPRMNVQAVFSTAEVMPIDWATRISKVFGCPVKSYYGCGEVNSMGFQIETEGPYRIPDEHVVVESVDGGTTGVTETNTLLVTSLYNKAQPLIRYINGDIGVVLPAGECHPVYNCIHPLLGRVADLFVRPDGTRVSSSIGPHMIFITKLPVQQYQFIQWELNRIEFRYMSTNSDISQPQLDEIASILRAHVSRELKVEFNHTTDFILSRNGKQRIVVVTPNVIADSYV